MFISCISATQLLSTLSVPNPAFLGLVDDKLTVSSFSLFSSKIIQFGYSSESKSFSDGLTVPNSNKMYWPNEIVNTNTPSKGALIGDGFLVPGKAQGSIWFLANGAAKPITPKMSGWFYHKVLELDVNKDGIMDLISCRAKVGSFGGETLSKLVWLDGSKNFKEFEILDGCDVNFIITDLDNDGFKEIIYSGFWSQSLSIVTTSNGRFDNFESLSITEITNKIGNIFNLQLADINNDGIMEILVSNHQTKKDSVKGAVYTFTPNMVGKIEQWEWIMNIIINNIPVRNTGPNEASPGTAITLPKHNSKGYPYIAVSGDGSQDVLMLIPTNSEFQYTAEVITDCGSTVGELLYGALDGEDLLMVPCYGESEIRFYKL
eukprot:NODE_620_length_5922_cov_0.203160.p2 type:complete len:375 gc:universal NODE_620_length_5922_cov_0.203160:3987-5111(+)